MMTVRSSRMNAAGQITVEFFGVPRLRAGRAELTVTARTVAELLTAIRAACPQLGDVISENDLSPHYLLSLNGNRFLTEPGQSLKTGDRVLLLSADAGG
jgi:molybdopterin converting factor small subunit